MSDFHPTHSSASSLNANLSVLIVTGMAGAGLSTALDILEDVGFEVIDNLPFFLVPHLIHLRQNEAPSNQPELFASTIAASTVAAMLPSPTNTQAKSSPMPLALGIDSRTRDFSAAAFGASLEDLKAKFPDPNAVQVLFLACDAPELERRFQETRRRHPLAKERPLLDGIAQDFSLMNPLRELADVVLDTTTLKVPDLRYELQGRYGTQTTSALKVHVLSFGFKYGIPREADMVLDVRFLKNPYYDLSLRPLTGLDAIVQDAVSADPVYAGFMQNLKTMLQPLLPRYKLEGKNYLTIAIGCTGGQHRSVTVAEELNKWLGETLGQNVILTHRNL